jgi:hypothetical protein
MTPRATAPVNAFHDGVIELCKDRLREALSAGTGLYDRQLRDRKWDATIGTEDLTSTAICLISIHRAAIDPASIGLDPTKTLRALVEVTRRRAYRGGLGLVVWANAVWGGISLDDLTRECGIPLTLSKGELDTLTTMELAWLASGLLHEGVRTQGATMDQRIGAALGALLERHIDQARIFCHSAEGASASERLRRWVPNFADQIYSVQACAFAGQSRSDKRALAASEACAARLVELQGSLGQWWWHYDARDGKVAQGFPVYSVHQHAMAPMALMALAAAGGKDHRAAVELSHAWIATNELSAELLDRSAGTLWRDIELEEGQLSRVARHARSISGLKPSDGGMHATNLKVNHETRPYEWGWCLYAGAIANGSERAGHLV